MFARSWWKRKGKGAADAPAPALSLALQGGGAHGAYTWGVLDRLLEEPWLQIDGISGTSAGAMNAATTTIGPSPARRARSGRRTLRRVLLSLLLFVLVAGALAWMHLAIRRMERAREPGLRRLPELPEMASLHPASADAVRATPAGVTPQ